MRNVSEEIWLNEARAEYILTFLGYDDPYEGSNLQKRVNEFLKAPSDSLTEWLNKKEDYGIINLFTHYLVDHYGMKILVDSLHSSKVGIPSINEALAKNGFKEDFSQIFTDFTIAVLVNDCSLGQKYCFLNPNLKNLKIVPQTNFLPLIGESTLSIINATKNWAGNWHKIIGGKNVLKFEFQGNPEVNFRIPYLIEDSGGKIEIDFFQLDKNQKGTIYIPDFNTKNKSLIIIPTIQTKTSGFDGLEDSYQFSFTVSTIERTPEEEAKLIEQLLAQIDFLKKEIARVQAQINEILAKRGQLISCQKLENDLYFGMMNNPEVRCLQEFLKSRGPEIYPEGLVTGNFLSLTLAAVKRYQASKGLIQTGYFGPLTRAAANKDLGY
jgi:peptidoglycan hydrolase-like protein with peptidoglycan-binding domain